MPIVNDSYRAFLNSFLRDYAGSDRIALGERCVRICNKFEIEIIKKSLTGNHMYGQCWLIEDSHFIHLPYTQFVSLLCDEFFGEKYEMFKYKVFESAKNLAKNLDREQPEVDSYLSSETQLLFGHPFHPYPKYKGGLSDEEKGLYSPEVKNSITLVWLKLSAKHFTSSIDFSEYRRKVSDLVKFDLEVEPTEAFYLPMHPLQFKRLKMEYPELAHHYQMGKKKWTVLSSMRSIVSPGAPWALKFSLDVELTNSIRHLRFEELIRGEQVCRVVDGVNNDHALELIREPFYVTMDEREEYCVQFRENIDIPETARLLSHLCEKRLDTYSSNLSLYLESNVPCHNEIIQFKTKWFENFLDKVVDGFLSLIKSHGIILGAHLQNIIVDLNSEGFISKVYYRDFQGSGFLIDKIEELGVGIPYVESLKKNILSLDDLNKVFGYYFVVNTVFGVVGALANWNEIEERIYLAQFRKYLIKLEGLESFKRYLLESSHIWQKGNFRCCIEGHNENTMGNPWDIYNKIDNPLVSNFPAFGENRKATYKAQYRNYELEFTHFESEEDYEAFYRWQNQDFVDEFWEMKGSKDQLYRYINQLKDSHYQEPMLFKVNGKRVGYFEFYWAVEDRIAPFCRPQCFDRGLHLLIGERNFLNTRFVYLSMLHASRFLFLQDERTQNIWGEPRSDNKKIKKFAASLPGWEYVRDFSFPHKKASLLRCSRNKFFEELGGINV